MGLLKVDMNPDEQGASCSALYSWRYKRRADGFPDEKQVRSLTGDGRKARYCGAFGI